MDIVSSREVFKNKLFSVVDEVAHDPDGFQIHRSIVRHPGSAVMMAVEKERILLVRQFRLPAEEYLWELPAGRLDPGESALQAAQRELREETGYKAENWISLAEFWASPGYVGEKMHVFLATGLAEGRQEPMDDERIGMQWFSADEVGRMVHAGEIKDAKTMIGYFMYLDYQRT
jgi:ADP-ribose pyrophosphatase